jgi:RimJ/RimL family protein N-acetyltransferase
MIIQLKRLVLRPLELKDSFFVAKHLNNYNVIKNLRDFIPFPFVEKDAIDFIDYNNQLFPAQNLAIVIEGEVAGIIGIVPQEDIHRINAEIGYWLGEDYWGKGFMTEAVNAMVSYSFKNFPILRLYASVSEANLGSMKVLEKAGFLKEAIFKNAIIKNGKIFNEHIYSLLKSD